MKKLKTTFDKLLFALTVITSLCVLTLSSTVSAALRDGTSWTECQNRVTHGAVSWTGATMYVYRCSNGFVFAHLKSSTRASINVQITRNNPYANQLSSGYAYSVTTNMLYLYNGACYTARGYNGASREYKFCW